MELHSWGAVMPRPTHADRLTFDLDPGADLPYPPLRDAALAIRKLMQDLRLESWIKTTGGKGLHVVVPLGRPLPDWDTAKEFARSVTLFMERLAPTMFTSKTGEKNRKKKIFVDYLRNGFGATAVAAFSPRWRPGVGVSTPVAWEEIDEDIRGTHFNLHNVPDRIAKQRKDPGRATGVQPAPDQDMINRWPKWGRGDPVLLANGDVPITSRCGTRRRCGSPGCPLSTLHADVLGQPCIAAR